MMKSKYILVSIILFFLYSCNKQEDKNSTSLLNERIELSNEEFLSIAYGNPGEISEERAREILEQFLNVEQIHTKSSNEPSIITKLYLDKDLSLREMPTKSNKNEINGVIPVFKAEIITDNFNSIAYVCADARYPVIMAYIPQYSEDMPIYHMGAEVMLRFSNKATRDFIMSINYLQDSLRFSTLNKIGADSETFNLKDYLSLIRVKDRSIATKSRPITEQDFWFGDAIYDPQTEDKLNSIVKVTWDQDAPFNRMLKQSCEWNAQLEGRPPVGCVGTCMAMILSHFEPSMMAGAQVMNWKLLKETSTITNSSSSEKIRQVSGLMKFVAEKIRTKFDCEQSSAYVSNGIAFLKDYGITMDDEQNFNYTKIVESLDKGMPVLITGTSRDNNSHAFLLTGYWKKKNSYGPQYVYASMCWSGFRDGYYLVNNNNVTFDYPEMYPGAGVDPEDEINNIEKNLKIYPNLRRSN